MNEQAMSPVLMAIETRLTDDKVESAEQFSASRNLIAAGAHS
jgi:hypothetical protein